MGFHQSYLFAGPFGGGKTTLGRILARALLCDNPTPTGESCDQCPSCQSFLQHGTSIDFVEVDAATNSGKAEIQKIVEDIQYDTFSGKRRLYLFDEAHQLTPGALDAMLKPLEENLPGSQDKRLVCIFCTTEPERMRQTILSRCAPAFMIRPVEPEVIAQRLEMICKAEGYEYDPAMLPLIASTKECHVRDAIKAIEGVHALGPINRENVAKYLHLDLNDAYLALIENLGVDLSASLQAAKKILERTSPITCYEKLADVAIMAYHVSLGAVKPPVYWDAERLKAVGVRLNSRLLVIANRFASRPNRATASMLFCDLGQLHLGGGGFEQQILYAPAPQVAYAPSPVIPDVRPDVPKAPAPSSVHRNIVNTPEESKESGSHGNVTKPSMRAPSLQGGGVHVDRRAVRKREKEDARSEGIPGIELTPDEFCRLLAIRMTELDSSGHSRRLDMGGARVDPAGRG